jgi:gliding motility-associated-like protein
MVTVRQAPVADFIADRYTVQLPDAAVQFTNQSANAIGYLWDFGAGSNSTEEHPSTVYAVAGTYPVTLYALSDEVGCEDSITKEIIVKDAVGVFIPTAFSPNGDGANDVFNIKTKNATVEQVMIFNRWGEKIFETNDIREGWDGSYLGVVQPLGVYAYVVKAVFIDNTEKVYSGNVTLVK